MSSLNLMELPLPVLAKIFRLTLDLFRTPYKQQKWWEDSCRSPLRCGQPPNSDLTLLCGPCL